MVLEEFVIGTRNILDGWIHEVLKQIGGQCIYHMEGFRESITSNLITLFNTTKHDLMLKLYDIQKILALSIAPSTGLCIWSSSLLFKFLLHYLLL